MDWIPNLNLVYDCDELTKCEVISLLEEGKRIVESLKQKSKEVILHHLFEEYIFDFKYVFTDIQNGELYFDIHDKTHPEIETNRHRKYESTSHQN